MPTAPQPGPKVVYLFGAGAAHAELNNLYEDLDPIKLGLLTTNVWEMRSREEACSSKTLLSIISTKKLRAKSLAAVSPGWHL